MTVNGERDRAKRVETRVRIRARRQKIRNAVLTTVGAAGVLAVALAAPNTLQLLKYLPKQKAQYRFRAHAALKRLASQGYLHISNGSARLTPKGQRLLDRIALQEGGILGPKRWDGKWRVVMFDVPEHRHAHRNQLRFMLRKIGFHMLQASVWVYPYDCEELVLLLKADHELGKEVLYMVVEEMENDMRLRQRFQLLNN